jgi:hypothetical protein
MRSTMVALQLTLSHSSLYRMIITLQRQPICTAPHLHHNVDHPLLLDVVIFPLLTTVLYKVLAKAANIHHLPLSLTSPLSADHRNAP